MAAPTLGPSRSSGAWLVLVDGDAIGEALAVGSFLVGVLSEPIPRTRPGAPALPPGDRNVVELLELPPGGVPGQAAGESGH